MSLLKDLIEQTPYCPSNICVISNTEIANGYAK